MRRLLRATSGRPSFAESLQHFRIARRCLDTQQAKLLIKSTDKLGE